MSHTNKQRAKNETEKPFKTVKRKDYYTSTFYYIPMMIQLNVNDYVDNTIELMEDSF